MAEEKSGTPGIGTKVLKGIGIVTAVISLILGVRQIVNMIQDNAARKAKAAGLQAEARQLASTGLYSQAWETMSQAAAVDADVREPQVQLAMEWLRNVRISPNQKEKSFTEIVNKLMPVLHGATDTTRREDAATVRAHIGWAGYLLFREGDRSVKVGDQFREALRLDPANVYARVMYGFWLLYPGHAGGTIDEANRYFAEAVKSGSQKEYVRSLMIAAYQNKQRPDYQAQIIRITNEMRVGGERLERAERERILADAYFLYRNEIFEEVDTLLPPGEHQATFTYLTDGVDINAKHYLAEAKAKLISRVSAER